MPFRKYVCFALASLVSAVAPAGATLSVTGTADVYLHGNGEDLGDYHAPPSQNATAQGTGTLQTRIDGAGGGQGPGSVSAQGTAFAPGGSVTGSAAAVNYQSPGTYDTSTGPFTTGSAEAYGYSALSYSFFNNSPTAVHAYFDFALSGLYLEVDNARDPIGGGQSLAAALLYGTASLNGQSILGNSLLYGGTLTGTAGGTYFDQSFDPNLIAPISTLGCSPLVTLCQGGIRGTLDLGPVGVGDTLALDYLLKVAAYADPSGVSPSGFADVSVGTQSCEGPCSAAGFRFLPLVTEVPEPATWLSMILGLALVAMMLRKRPDMRFAYA